MTGFESVVGINPWTALFTFGNMMVTFLLLKKFLFKPVKNMIDSRRQEIDDMYAEAEKSRSEAAAMEAEYAEKLGSAAAESEQMLREAAERAGKRERELISAAEKEAGAIRERAAADIEQEKKKALNEVKNEISDIAMEIASRVISREVKADDNRALVEDFIGKLGEE